MASLLSRSLAIAAVAALLPLVAPANERLLIQSTTSTQNSGLYDHLLPIFESITNIKTQVVAVGTGQALRNAQNCDGDILVVHARSAEDAFVEAGYGSERRDLMYNDFVIVGPADDPADLMSSDLADAMKILNSGAFTFVSRGDDSGTHKKERQLWGKLMPDAAVDRWYLETGSGMGATLNIAVALGAYTLSDRSTWVAFKNKRTHRILVEGDPSLTNPYGIIPVSQEHCPNANGESAKIFLDWVTGDAGQAVINAFRVDGQQLFFAGAPPD